MNRNRFSTEGDRAANGIERWKAGLGFLAMILVAGFASFIVAAIPMKIAAALFAAPYLGSVTNILALAMVAIFPWLVTHRSAARVFRSVLGDRR
jgi:VIT1/CCC1 family predicted Fe2+/Mn2+ transporter